MFESIKKICILLLLLYYLFVILTDFHNFHYISFQGVMIYTVQFDTSANDLRPIKELKSEIFVKTFIWAQWDMINQVLYHIHHRRIPASVVTENDDENNLKSSKPTLSGLQFHDDLPHETVVSIFR